MKKPLIQFVIVVALLLFAKVNFGQAPDLRSTAAFSLFSSNGAVTNSGATSITGNVGSNVGVTAGYSPSQVSGTIYSEPDNFTNTCATDLLRVYDYLNNLSYDIELTHPEQFGNNLVLTPHTYLLNTATVLTDSISLDAGGNAGAVFVIKVNGALSTSTYAKVKLINGTDVRNVFWFVDGSVNLNNYSDFKGTIICSGAINLNTGATLNGRALTTNGALNTTSITAVIPAPNGTTHSTYTWIGGSGDWNVASNWSTTSATKIPAGCTADVIIGSGSPTISTPVSAGNVQVSSMINLSVTGSLSVCGNFTGGNGDTASVIGAGKVMLTGSTPQTLSGNTTFSNLELNNAAGASIQTGSTVSIAGLYTPSSGILVTNGGLVLQSSSAGTAVVAKGNGNYIDGSVTIEKYVPAKRAWWLLTAPVTASTTQTIHDAWQEGAASSTDDPHPGYGTHITGGNIANGFDQSPGNSSSIKYYSNGWINLNNTNTTGIASQPGYFVFVRGNRSYEITSSTPLTRPSATTLRVKGNLNEGTKTMAYNNPATDQFILVGNPYMAPIDFNTIAKNNIKNTFWAWDPQRRGTKSGGYVTVSWDAVAGTYDIDYSPGQTGQTQIIQSGQAVLTQVKNAGSAASITFNETDKVSTGTVNRSLRDGADITQQLRITLNDTGDSSTVTADGVLAKFGTGYNIGTEDDAAKVPTADASLALTRSGVNLSIERRPLITQNDTLHLSMKGLTLDSQYNLQFNGSNFASEPITAFLIDQYSGLRTPVSLTANGTVNFKVDNNAASADSSRFILVFNPSYTLPVTLSGIKAGLVNKDVQVEWRVQSETDVQQYVVERSVDGAHYSAVASVTAKNRNTSETYTQIDATPNQGDNFYRIKIVKSNGAISYSTIAKVRLENGAGSFSVYPNPVKDKKATIQLINLAAGTYHLQLFDLSGHQLLNNQINHGGSSSSQQVSLPSGTASGTYYFVLKGADSSTTFKQTILVL